MFLWSTVVPVLRGEGKRRNLGGVFRARTAKTPEWNRGKPDRQCRYLLHPESSEGSTKAPRVVVNGLSCALVRFKVKDWAWSW